MFAYPVVFEDETNGSVRLSCPDIPELHSFGKTRAEALKMAVEALDVALSFYVEAGEDLPKPSVSKAETVRPSLIAELKLGLYQTMRDNHIRKTELAKRMGASLMQVDRLLDLTHSSRIQRLEAAYAALGKRLNISLEAA